MKHALERFIDMDQPLVLLADRIDWDQLASNAEVQFSKEGRPGVPSRFMLGMLMLKSVENLSDEDLFAQWPRDPYCQYFTRELYFQHQVPHERSGLSHWRTRLGSELLDHLLQESLRVAHDTGALRGSDMDAVTVDTTVQEKVIRFPTDAQLLYTALIQLGLLTRQSGLKLRLCHSRGISDERNSVWLENALWHFQYTLDHFPLPLAYSPNAKSGTLCFNENWKC